MQEVRQVDSRCLSNGTHFFLRDDWPNIGSSTYLCIHTLESEQGKSILSIGTVPSWWAASQQDGYSRLQRQCFLLRLDYSTGISSA